MVIKRGVVLCVVLVLISGGLYGCGGKTDNQASFDNEPIAVQQANPRTNKVQPGKGQLRGQQSTQPLVLKSENPVIVGSSQQVFDQLDSATNDLVKSLDSMDSLDDNDLNF